MRPPRRQRQGAAAEADAPTAAQSPRQAQDTREQKRPRCRSPHASSQLAAADAEPASVDDVLVALRLRLEALREEDAGASRAVSDAGNDAAAAPSSASTDHVSVATPERSQSPGVQFGPMAELSELLCRLERLPGISPEQLKRSALGLELNHRHWRHHRRPEVAARTQLLVARWKAAVAEARAAASPGGARKAAAASPGAPEAAGPSARWNAAWAEAVAGRCARELEGAAWSAAGAATEAHRRVAGSAAAASPRPAGDAVDGMAAAAHLRSYKAKVRLLAAELRRPENADLRKGTLEGTVPVADLAARAAEDFLPAVRLEERRKVREEALREVTLKKKDLDFFDSHLVCPICLAAGARYSILRDSWALPRCGGCQGYMRADTGKCILAECASCGEQWQADGVV